MKYSIEVYNALCSTSSFKINGKDADSHDFGEQFDHDPENAEPYCCGDMRFERIPSTAKVLKKYKITQADYDKICDDLEYKLSFGACGWCV